jgi:hypothetical protein
MQPVSPTTTTTTVRTADAFRKPHPIRGILWGLVMGIGAAAIAILLKIIPFDLVWALIVLGGGILLGILWSTLGPAKKPKGEPPWRPEPVTQRADWDTGSPAPPAPPIPPTPPVPPGVEPLHIQPLDVEPLDLDSPASDVPDSDVPDGVTSETQPRLPAEPDVPDVPAVDPPRTVDPPERSDPPPPPPPPPPPAPPPPPPPPPPPG